MKLDLGIPITFGEFSGVVFGGPYRKYEPGTRRLIGVKMAAEIDHVCDFSVPTKDFSVPAVYDLQQGLIGGLSAIKGGKDVYVGCMGGVGRTGLYMGCLVKCMQDAGLFHASVNPVSYVRSRYKGSAIETQEQQEYVKAFPSGPVVDYLRKAMTTATEQDVCLWDCIKGWWNRTLG